MTGIAGALTVVSADGSNQKSENFKLGQKPGSITSLSTPRLAEILELVSAAGRTCLMKHR